MVQQLSSLRASLLPGYAADPLLACRVPPEGEEMASGRFVLKGMIYSLLFHGFLAGVVFCFIYQDLPKVLKLRGPKVIWYLLCYKWYSIRLHLRWHILEDVSCHWQNLLFGSREVRSWQEEHVCLAEDE